MKIMPLFVLPLCVFLYFLLLLERISVIFHMILSINFIVISLDHTIAIYTE